MAITFVGRVRATVISPGTPLEFPYTCEEFIEKGSAVAKSETTRKILLAQANTYDRMPAFGIAVESKDIGELINVISIGMATNVQKAESFDYDDVIYVSTEKGKLTKTPPGAVGDLVQIMGRALNSSDVILNPSEQIVEIKEL